MAKRLSTNSHRHRHYNKSHHRKQHKKNQGSIGHPWLWSLSFQQKKVDKRQMNPYQSIADFDPRLQAGTHSFMLKGSKYRKILYGDLKRIMRRPSNFTRWDYLMLVKAIHRIVGHKHYMFQHGFPHPVIDVLYTAKHDTRLNSTLDAPIDPYEKRELIDDLDFTKRYRFYGTFVRSGIAQGQRIMLLFKNLHIFPSGKLVARHIWVECCPSILKLGQLYAGDWIMLTARPTMYEKYFNYTTRYEYGLRAIQNADRVQSWLDATAPEMPTDNLALTGYVMLANCHFYAQTHWFDLQAPEIQMLHIWERDHHKLKIPQKFELK